MIDNVESAVKKLHSAGDLGASALPARAAVSAAPAARTDAYAQKVGSITNVTLLDIQ